ncbi:HNH endonuclease signature motif containing protein [Streptomyces sp. NPDC096048]|uniref:HNH endonuclease signature motif containing protein n=1 Tax=Streptomyces sp. NPDC096048 TaxID=3366072 RepID=UPI00381479E3
MHLELEAVLRDWAPVAVALPDGTSRTAQVTDLRRLLEKVEIDESGCWRWTGFISHKGYGRFRFASNVGHAHRFAYVVLVGPIGDGLEIDHLCRERSCINPEHLEAVTHSENLQRRHPAGLPTHCQEGHEYTPENTYRRPNGARLCRTCKNAEKARYRARVAARKADR